MDFQYSEATKRLEAGLNKLNFGFFLGERLRVLDQELAAARLRNESPTINGAYHPECWKLEGHIAEIKHLISLVNRSLEGQ